MKAPKAGAAADLQANPGTFPARADWIFLAGVTALYILFFWPGIVAGHLLAPGDGRDYFLPMFLARKTIWDPALQNGYPLTGDPQIMTWYPVARLFSLLGSWNAFILFCYIGAACSMYLYALRLVGHRGGAAVAGVVYSMSGFMAAHLGHVTFINAACWIPGVLLGVEQAARRASWRWAMAAAGCLSMMLVSGNPQLTLYTCLFAVARLAALAIRREVRVRAAAAALVGAAALAAGIGAIQVLPSRELQSLTPRAAIDYGAFSVFSLHPVELITGLFPFVLGSSGSPLYPQKYIGWNFAETSFHLGFMTLFLALAAFQLRPRQARFWGWAFLGVALMASDGETALGPLLFHVPYYQLFRAHGRWLLFADLAAALAAGHGFAALAEGVAWRDALRLARRFAWALAAALFALFSLSPWVERRAAQLGYAGYHVSFGINAVRFPVALAVLSAGALVVWMRYPRWRLAQAAVVCGLLACMASEARYDEWRTRPFTEPEMQPPAALDRIAGEARTRHDSLLSLDPGGEPTYDGEPIDYCRVWRWPSLSFYHSLYVDRLGQALAMSDNGLFHGEAALFMGPTPDVYGLEFVSVTPRPATATIAYGKLQLPDTHLDFTIGSGAGLPHAAPTPIPVDTQKILMVSTLAGSIPVKQGDAVAEAVVSLASGEQAVYPIRAGIDTAEHALECLDVRPYIQHGLAPVFSTEMRPRGGQVCAIHDYLASIDLGARGPIRGLTLRYVSGAGALIVKRVWYVRADGSITAADITSGVTGDPLHWRARGATPHSQVFENLRVLDRAWVAASVRKLAPAEMQLALRSGAFPDGSPFDPRETALVESDVAGWTGGGSAAGARVQVSEPSDTSLEVDVDAPARGFLVVRDLYYPGWRATRNGAEVAIYQTNYIERGVVVEAGHSQVRFAYRPASIELGAGITLAALAFAAVACWNGRLRRLMDRALGQPLG